MSDEQLLSVLIDAADRTTRVKNRGWQDYWTVRNTCSRATYDNVWVDPIGGVVMLQPLQLLPNLRDADSTIPRLSLANYTINAGAWNNVVVNPYLATDYWQVSDGTANASLTTNYTFEKNQAFYFCTFIFAGQSDNRVQCKLTFGQYRLDIYTTGFTQLYKSSVLVDSGYVTAGPVDLSGRVLDIMIQPYKRNQILFWSQTGGSGWVYLDIDIITNVWNDESEITTSGKVTVTFPTTAGRFQLMSLNYETEGYYYTGVMESFVPPTAAQQADPDFSTKWSADASANGHTSGIVGTLLEATTNDLFTADGIKNAYRGRTALIGNGNWTPFFYSITTNWPKTTDAAAVDQLDVTEDVTAMSISVSEDASQSTATFTLRYADSKYSALARKAGRHVLIRFGLMEVFWGVMKIPEYHMDLNDLSSYTITVESIFRWFEIPNLPTSGAWDGKPHTDFMKWIVLVDDFTTDDLSWPATAGEPLPGQVTKDGKGQWAPEGGDTKKSWIGKVTDITGWTFDDAPIAGRMKLRYASPDDIDTTPKATLYVESADNPDDYKTWVKALTENAEEPEGTQLWMVGCTDDDKCLKAAVYIDFPAEDGTLMEESRPANWMGRCIPIKYAIGNIKSLADLEKLAYYVGKDITRVRVTCDIDGEFILGLWRGDRITMLGETWKILGFDVEIIREQSDFTLRPTKYKLELVP